jgi:ATP-dependent RNA helicase RhlE
MFYSMRKGKSNSQSSRNYSQGNRGNSFQSSRSSSRFNRGPRKFIKKLDPALFVNRAIESNSVGSETKEELNGITFDSYAIDAKLKRNIQEHGYTSPTEIQEKAIPEILAGRDVIGMANTGTGKTAAFLITLINKSFMDRNQRVLIVVPTRELAIQIRDEFRIFARGTDLEAVAIIGGADIRRQTFALRHRPHFIIGTPGRLKDLISRRVINLTLFQNVVLDEVDRMVDIGFRKDIENIISLLPQERQSLFFSATVDAKTKDILQKFVKDPVTISLKKQNTATTIDQDIVRVKGEQSKLNVLHDLLIQSEFEKVIIFGRTKWGIQKLTNELVSRGFNADAIHGNKNQNQRQRVLQEFKNNKIQILLATDVASRGLDIENVTHVINYDAPESYDDYVHRIGRTGRAGKKGTALTFID